MYGVLALLVIAYVGICILLFVKQRDLLYFPTAALKISNAEPISIEMDAGKMKGWVVNPGKTKAMIYFGGNGEQVERNADFFTKCLPEQSVFLMPYRGYGGNPGAPSETGIFADALALESHVRMNYPEVSLMGRSLGSGVATYLASQKPIVKTLLITPYDSIADVAADKYPLFPVRWLLKDRYNSAGYAGLVKSKVKIMIAMEDAVIPPSHSFKLVSAFKQKPTVKVISGVGHNSISSAEDYAFEVCDFLK